VVVKEALGLRRIKLDPGCGNRSFWTARGGGSRRRWITGGRSSSTVLERELDFSVQLEMGTAGMKLVGYTFLINDRKGPVPGQLGAANYSRRNFPPA